METKIFLRLSFFDENSNLHNENFDSSILTGKWYIKKIENCEAKVYFEAEFEYEMKKEVVVKKRLFRKDIIGEETIKCKKKMYFESKDIRIVTKTEFKCEE